MRCRGLESSLCLLLVAVVTAGCASLPGASSLMPGGAAKTNQTLDAQLAMARLSERHGDARTAEQIYQAVLQKDPQNRLCLHRLGVLAAKVGEHDKAAEHLNAAAQLGPPSSELLNDIGFNLFVMGKLPEAEAIFRQAVAADPQNKAARNNLGLVLGETQRYEESLAEFRRGNGEAEAHANLAYAKTQAGDLVGAKSSYYRALTLNNELKPAAEALVQLVRQPSPPAEADVDPAEPRRLYAPGPFDRYGMRERPSRDKTLAELVREGKTSDFLESVTERDRVTGRADTFRPPMDAPGPIAQVSYLRADGPANVRSRMDTSAMPSAGGPRAARIPASAARSIMADELAVDSSWNQIPAASTGGVSVLRRIFCFPSEIKAVPADTGNQEASSLRSGASNPIQPAEAGELPTASPRPGQRPHKRKGNLLSSFEPRAAIPSSPPPDQTISPTGSVSPSATGFAAPSRMLSSTPTASAPSPWQSPTWTPDFVGLFSAAAPPASTAPHDTILPTP
jgi:Tfp pilus assembly protein PilF